MSLHSILRPATVLAAVAVLATTTMALAGDDAAMELDAETLAHIEAQLESELAAGGPAPRGIQDIHGLVRTRTVSGNYSDLPDQTGPDGPEFGYSTAISGDWLAVGAPGTIWTHATFGTEQHGVVFVFQRVGGTWLQRQRIQEPTGYDGARCGHAVALRMPHLVFGCPESAPSPGAPAAGYVFIRLFDEATQSFQALEDYHSENPGRCGAAIALTRNYLAHGCPTARDEETGRVSVRKRNPGTQRFTEFEGNRLPPGTSPGMNFGESVALYEPSQFDPIPLNVRLAVGAPNTVYAGSIWPRGSVYLFHRELASDSWSLNTTLRLSATGDPGNDFADYGAALAMNRTQLIVGAPNNRYGALQSLPGPGSAHRYALSSLVGWQPQEDGGGINPPDGPHAGMRFGAALALGWSGMSFIGSPGTDGETNGGATAPEVGMLDVRRTGSGDWSVFNYYGELRPAPLTSFTRFSGHFGHALNADVVNHRLAVGYPHSGATLAPRPNGSVWIYEPDSLFDNGFQCEGAAPGCD